jgi:hypothetical protein
MFWMDEFRARADIPSDMSHYLPVLFGTVARYPAAQVVELVVRAGTSTVGLLAGAEVAGGHVWSVDIDAGCAFRQFTPQPDPALWTFIGADSVSWEAVAGTPGKIDVLFIDSSHEYRETCNELDLYLPKVVPGGTVLLHDTSSLKCHVREALEETLPDLGLTWHEYGGACGLGVIVMPDQRPRTVMPIDPEDDPMPCV